MECGLFVSFLHFLLISFFPDMVPKYFPEFSERILISHCFPVRSQQMIPEFLPKNTSRMSRGILISPCFTGKIPTIDPAFPAGNFPPKFLSGFLNFPVYRQEMRYLTPSCHILHSPYVSR